MRESSSRRLQKVRKHSLHNLCARALERIRGRICGIPRELYRDGRDKMSFPTTNELNQTENWWNNHSEKERDELFLTSSILRNHYFLHRWDSLTHSEQNMITQFLKEKEIIQSEGANAKDS